MEKLTQEYIVMELKKKGYTVLEEYNGANKPILCEKNGYKGLITYNNLKNGKKVSFFSVRNKYCLENAKLFIYRKNPKCEIIDIKIITKKQKKQILFKFKCSCGNIYNKTFNSIRNDNTTRYVLCDKCSKKAQSKNSRLKLNDYKKIFTLNDYKILSNLAETPKKNDMIEVQNTQGYKGYVSVTSLKNKSNMVIFNISKNKQNFIYNANNYCRLSGIDTKVLGFSDEEKWTRQGILCLCKCGNEFNTSITSFMNGKQRCDVCSNSISKYEIKVENFLKSNNIEYIREFKINSCKDLLPLPFDFYIKSNKGLIEIDGEGHFYPCRFNGCSKESAIKSFNTCLKHDKIKNKYCKEFNIKLLRISYLEIQNETYKNKIIQFIRD